jgi:serine/threonine protein kinase
VKRNYSIGFRNLIKELLQKNPDMRPSARQVMEHVTQLQNKLRLDRFQLWSQYYQEMLLSTSIINAGVTSQNSR